MSERQLFTFEIASNGCLHKHDNQSHDTLNTRSLAIGTNKIKILKVLNPVQKIMYPLLITPY